MKHYFNTNKVLAAGLMAVATITIFFACKKDDKQSGDKRDTQTLAAAQSQAEVSAVYDDVFQVTLNTSFTESTLTDGRVAAPTHARELDVCIGTSVEITPVEIGAWPKTVIIDFGANGCTSNGRTRKGKLRFELTKFLFHSGGTAEVTFENYSVNDVKIEGTQTITNTTTDNSFGYNYTVSNGVVTYPDGRVHTYTGTRTIQQTEGSASLLDIGDDVWSLTGNAQLTVLDTLTNTTNTAIISTAEALIKKGDCAYVSKGILEVALNGYKAKINYGDGNCDDKAVLSVGDKSKEITLPR